MKPHLQTLLIQLPLLLLSFGTLPRLVLPIYTPVLRLGRSHRIFSLSIVMIMLGLLVASF